MKEKRSSYFDTKTKNRIGEREEKQNWREAEENEIGEGSLRILVVY